MMKKGWYLGFRLLSVVLPGCFACGCAWIDDIGQAESHASMELEAVSGELGEKLSCAVGAFPLKFMDFDADQPTDNTIRIRMFEGIKDSMWKDYMYLSFVPTNADTLESCPDVSSLVGQNIAVSSNGCVRAYVQINSCSSKVTARIVGTLNLSEFSLDRGKRIAGTIAGELAYVEKVESTTDVLEKSTSLGSLSGEFSFVNHVGIVWND